MHGEKFKTRRLQIIYFVSLVMEDKLEIEQFFIILVKELVILRVAKQQAI